MDAMFCGHYEVAPNKYPRAVADAAHDLEQHYLRVIWKRHTVEDTAIAVASSGALSASGYACENKKANHAASQILHLGSFRQPSETFDFRRTSRIHGEHMFSGAPPTRGPSVGGRIAAVRPIGQPSSCEIPWAWPYPSHYPTTCNIQHLSCVATVRVTHMGDMKLGLSESLTALTIKNHYR